MTETMTKTPTAPLTGETRPVTPQMRGLLSFLLGSYQLPVRLAKVAVRSFPGGEYKVDLFTPANVCDRSILLSTTRGPGATPQETVQATVFSIRSNRHQDLDDRTLPVGLLPYLLAEQDQEIDDV